MDYEKAYKEALERARKLYEQGTITEGLGHVFPELKESEDERIRKEITRFLINFNNGCYTRPKETDVADWIAWLEKQGEQKSTDEVKPKFKVGDWVVYNRDDSSREIIQVYDIRDGRYYFTDNIHFSWSIKECDEKSHLWTIQDAKDGDVLSDEDPFIFRGFGDKKHPNNPTAYCGINVSGTFIVSTGNAWWTSQVPHPATKEQRDLLFQKMKEKGYEWDAEKKELKKIEQKSTWNEKIKGLNKLETYIFSLNPNRSLDAVKVDVKNIRFLVNDEQKSKTIPQWMIDFLDEYRRKIGRSMNYDEIRDIDGKILAIVNWMKDNPNIQQKPTPKFKIGDTIRKIGENTVFPMTIEKIEDGDYVCNNSHSFVNIKYQDDYELVEQKPAWSEEDEKYIAHIIAILEGWDRDHSSSILSVVPKYIDWLKSLKPQTHWKPSERQLKALRYTLGNGGEYDKIALNELYDALLNLTFKNER